MALKICVLASGRGSNFSAIINSIKSKTCDAQILCLITDNSFAAALDIAAQNKIPAHALSRKDFASSEDFENEILLLLDKYSPDLVVLAGYMRIIRSKQILQKYKIINIHPSLLPKYPGAQAQKDAFLAGEKISGLTIHLVDESLDGGPIIYQQEVNISDCKSADEVSDKILSFEHKAYPSVIDKISKGEIKLSNY